MDPQLYGQLIFNKAAKNVQWKEVSSINGVGELESDMQKNETGPFPYTTHKNRLKMDEWMKDLNVRQESIKILLIFSNKWNK